MYQEQVGVGGKSPNAAYYVIIYAINQHIMSNEEAIVFIKSQLSQGIKQEQIVGELMHQGFAYRDINQLIAQAMASGSVAPQQPAPSAPSNQNFNTAPQTQTYQQAGSSSGHKKTFVIIGIVAALVILGGAGAYAYYSYSNPDPITVLHKMMASISQVNSFSASLSGDFTDENSGGMDLFSGESASSSATTTTSKTHTELSADIDLADVNNPQFSINFSGNSGSGMMMVVLGGQLIYKDKTGYLKVNPGTSIGPISLNMISGQWVKIEPQKDISTSTIPGVGLGVSGDKLNVTPDQIAQVRNIIKNAYFFNNVTKLPDETVNGVSTRHYKFSVDETALNKFSDDVALVFDSNYVATTTPEIPQGANLEIWVGAGDYLPRKFVESDGKNQVQATYSNYNSIPAIQVPQDTKSFQSVLEEVFGSMFGSMTGTSTAPSPKVKVK